VDATRALPEGVANGGFDRVLVDAPCSGLGALRRNPDARWRVHPSDPGRLADTQRAILRNSISALRPGGTLVYSTCTLLPEENEGVIEALLRERKELVLVGRDAAPAALRELLDESGFLRTLPQQHDADGFFAARLERRA
jgi:16S rRNA (cytosine967-C5)-methyltransferase